MILEFLKKYRYDIIVLLSLLLLMLLVYYLGDKSGILSDRDSFVNFIRGFGIWAPLAIIAVIVLEVIIAPLPGFIPALSAGFIFGAAEGAFYIYVGNMLGSIAVFWLSRKLGRIVLEKIVVGEKIEKYEKVIAQKENILLVLYVFPFVPVDIISGVFGLSQIRFKKFLVAVTVGFAIQALILSLFGDYLASLYFVL